MTSVSSSVVASSGKPVSGFTSPVDTSGFTFSSTRPSRVIRGRMREHDADVQELNAFQRACFGGRRDFEAELLADLQSGFLLVEHQQLRRAERFGIGGRLHQFDHAAQVAAFERRQERRRRGSVGKPASGSGMFRLGTLSTLMGVCATRHSASKSTPCVFVSSRFTCSTCASISTCRGGQSTW